MSHRVEFSARAEADLREIYDHVRRNGPADPDVWKGGLDAKLSKLELFPHGCPLAPENDFSVETVRNAFYGPYRIVFVVRPGAVFVTSIRHGARRPLTRHELDG